MDGVRVRDRVALSYLGVVERTDDPEAGRQVRAPQARLRVAVECVVRREP